MEKENKISRSIINDSDTSNVQNLNLTFVSNRFNDVRLEICYALNDSKGQFRIILD